jgi:uncharacterized protein YjbI with pentapeptide repeats
MDINAVFSRKEERIEESKCSIEKVIELSESKFASFRANLLNEYDFIKDNADLMYEGPDGITRCILVLGEGTDDGILINSEGSAYGRYTAFVPYARTLESQIDRPICIKNMERDLTKYADEFLAHYADAEEKELLISDDDILNGFEMNERNLHLFKEVLSERNEIAHLENTIGGFSVEFSDTFIHGKIAETAPRRLLSYNELFVMQAKHILFMHGEPGGEKADFTDMDLMDLSFSCAHFSGAIFKGAKIDRCDMKDGVFACCDFRKAIFIEADAAKAIFSESDCEDAVFSSCDLHSSFFQGSNLKNTEFDNCAMGYSDISESDARGTSFIGCKTDGMTADSCITDEHTKGLASEPELKME